MSLRVWLPLNGDLHNQGLNNVTVTNNGATVSTSGKIGSCYSFGTSASGMNITNYDFSQFTECSVSVWLKIISWNTNYATYVQLGTNGRSWANYIFGVLRGASASKLAFVIGNTSSTTITNCLTSELELNTWYHFAFVYKNGNMKIYKNGALDTEYTTSIVPAFSSISKISLGRANDNGYQSNCLMNDVRIYDHALSEKEVEEIAKGLVLHYPLNHNGMGQPNLISNSYYNAEPWTSAITDTEVYKGKNAMIVQAKTLYQKTSSGTTCIFPLMTFKENTQYTISLDWCDHVRTDGNSTRMRLKFIYSDGTSNNIVSPDNSSTADWVHRTFTSTAGKTVSAIGSSYGSSGVVSIANLKIEEGAQATNWAPPFDESDNIEYDISGYCNNGTKIGTFTYSTDTPKYGVSTSFDGTTNCIKIPYNKINPDRIFTVNLWFKKDTLGAKNYETLFGGPNGFEMDTRAGSSTSLSLYMATVRGGRIFHPLDFNQWYMITMVRDGTNEMYYINAELKKTIEAKSMPSGQYYIGSWNGTTSQNYYGNISDFRIYATALSAQDILSLYHNSALVDEQGNIHGAIH